MTNAKSRPPLFERLQAALQDSIAHSRGELNLRTTVLPAPPPAMGAEDVARLRERLDMSQAVFAGALNVSTKTVQSWEQGAKRPSRASLRLLQVLPDIAAKLFATPVTTKSPSTSKNKLARRRNAPAAAVLRGGK